MSRLSLFIPSLAFLVMAALLVGCNEQPAEPLSPESLSGGPLPLSKMPADGNGNKEVVSWEETGTAWCNSGITWHMVIWYQAKGYGQPNNPNDGLTVWHAVITYTNAAGETWTWHDVGPDHFYYQDGILFWTITGTSGYSGVVGHVVINTDTGEIVFVAGRDFGDVDALACEALG